MFSDRGCRDRLAHAPDPSAVAEVFRDWHSAA
jgi:hypothetical protein